MSLAPNGTRIPTQSRAQQTQQALIAAAEREFSTRSYADVTAKTVALRGKTAMGSFYQYFTSKDDALRQVARRCQGDIVERAVLALDALPALDARRTTFLRHVRKVLRTIVEVTMVYHAHHRGLHAVLAERRHVDPELDSVLRAGERRIVERVAALLRNWGHEGDVDATAFVLFASIRGAIHAHVIGGPWVDDARFVDATVELLVRVAVPAAPAPRRSSR